MRFYFLILPLLLVIGCVPLPELDLTKEIDVPRYRHPGGATVTLVTVLGSKRGFGAHSALIVNGNQRVIFDPAGSLEHESLTIRGDVIYGANPAVVDTYIDYHTRNTHDTSVLSIRVPDEIAEDLLIRIMKHGYGRRAHCAQSISSLLHDTHGFENIRTTFFPKKLMENFLELKNVKSIRFSQPDETERSTKIYTWLGQKPLFNI